MSACTFFGHRDCPSSIKPKLRDVLIDLIENHAVDMVMKLRSHSGALTDALVRRYLSTEPVKKKCYKVPARIVEKYFVGMDPNKVDSIVEQALEAWFHKRKDGADV